MKKLAYIAMMVLTLAEPSVGRSDENRLNLWPLVGYDDGALDVIWPLGHFRDADDWRFFPVFRDRHSFVLFPEFWFMNRSFAVLPFWSTYDFDEGTLFSILWWNRSDRMNSVFPLYYYRGHDNGTTFWAGCGLGGYYSRGDKESAHWLFPAYVKNGRGIYSIPYSRVYEGDSFSEGYLCGLAGRQVSGDGTTRSTWCAPLWFADKDRFVSLPFCLNRYPNGGFKSWFSLPLLSGGWSEGDNSGLVTPVYGQTSRARWGLPGWYADEHSFVSPLWYQHTDDKGVLDQWMVPLLLSGGVYREGARRNGFLLNAAGWMSGDDGYFASWCLPLYFKDNDGTFITPLCGCNKTSQWCFPLWYRNQTTLLSPFWYQKNGPEGAIERWAVPLLLSGGGTHPDGRRNVHALLLYGHGADAKDETTFGYLFPLYYYGGASGSFYSLPYGRLSKHSSTNTWWATPLVGTYSGSKTGGWFFPFFNRRKDASFDRDLARLDAETLPEDIQFTKKVNTRMDRAGNEHVWTNTVASVDVRSSVHGSVLIGSDHDSSVWGSTSGKRYEIHTTSKQGNKLLFNRSTSRSVTFDIASRKKVGESSDSTTMALGGIFHRTHSEYSMNGRRNPKRSSRPVGTNTHTRVLWKLWDREEKDGDVTIDAFPGFTYDSRKDGYTKTSFLWRFFRYEKDPKKGTECDILFLPVIR